MTYLQDRTLQHEILDHLEDENHPEGCAEGEGCKEKVDSEEVNYPDWNCDENGHRICF